MAMISANGLVIKNQITTIKFRNISNQDCVVLDNCPDVLSVGQLISQGYDFIWLSDPANKLKNGSTNSSFDAESALASNDTEMAY